MEKIKIEPETVVVKPLDDAGTNPPSMLSLFSKKLVLIYIIFVAVGLVVGTGVYAFQSQGTAKVGGRRVELVKSDTEEGVKDPSTYKDTATGKLIPNDGKITSEGTHILVRGGSDQNVYLTSSVLDMTKYEGKVIQVWGQTYQGSDSSTGWLIDVGRVKIVE